MSDLQVSPERPLRDGVWTIDPQHSEIGFAVKAMWGLATVSGVFGAYDGTLSVRDGEAAGTLTIEAASLDTGNRRRDRHLRSADFFDVERHRQIVFNATSVTALDGGLTVAGELALASTRLPLEIRVNVEPAADGALRLKGTTTVSRTAAGLTWNWLGTIGGDAVLHAELALERARPVRAPEG